MSSMSGFITYIEYQYASNKGDTKTGDLISNPFGFGKVDSGFTGAKVVETATGTEFKPAWGPVIGDVEYEENGEWKKATPGDNGTYTVKESARVRYTYDNVVIPQNDLPMIKAEMKSISLVAKARRIAVYYSQIAA